MGGGSSISTAAGMAIVIHVDLRSRWAFSCAATIQPTTMKRSRIASQTGRGSFTRPGGAAPALRFLRRMPRLGAPLPDFLRGVEAIGAWSRDTSVPRAAWPALRRDDRRTARCATREHRLAFGGPERARRGRAWGRRRPRSPAGGRAREADTLTEGRGGARRGHRLDGDHQSGSSVSRGFPQDLGYFFCDDLSAASALGQVGVLVRGESSPPLHSSHRGGCLTDYWHRGPA